MTSSYAIIFAVLSLSSSAIYCKSLSLHDSKILKLFQARWYWIPSTLSPNEFVENRQQHIVKSTFLMYWMFKKTGWIPTSRKIRTMQSTFRMPDTENSLSAASCFDVLRDCPEISLLVNRHNRLSTPPIKFSFHRFYRVVATWTVLHVTKSFQQHNSSLLGEGR